MKYVYLFIIATLLSCSSSKQFATDVIHYRKSRCLGKCPVFDLYVYDNGKVIFKGVDHVKVKGEAEYQISEQKVKLLKGELTRLSSVNPKTQKGRDLPKTIVSFENRTLTFTGNKDLTVFNILLKELDVVN
ncbi:DUF6438 domain-containing protein [uncultured Tenacibaculum sp.]|uniref:DUF6438 domain-containing protein n=1 Tax=uncultured Tenacibaculum sp. TaxID=174713 RepID=UPI002628CB72|nr:DUF6438 domain-containing protein [uncultured Tenacibaculum sp.]